MGGLHNRFERIGPWQNRHPSQARRHLWARNRPGSPSPLHKTQWRDRRLHLEHAVRFGLLRSDDAATGDRPASPFPQIELSQMTAYDQGVGTGGSVIGLDRTVLS